MSLVLTDEQEMLRDAASGFLAEHAPVSQLRRLRDSGSEEGFDRATWMAMAEMGWTGILIDEAHGGVGLGHVEAALIAEEMGRTLTASPFLSSAVLSASLLSDAGSAGQRSRWLPDIATGRAIVALATDEGRCHDPSVVNTRAERSGNGFRLSGQKTFVMDAHVADALIVSARVSDDDVATLFLIPTDTPGVQITRTPMIDERNAGEVTLESVDVTADAVLGEVGVGGTALGKALSAGRAILAAEMSGCAQEALHRSIAYITERKQFGQRVGSFQALQHRAAHLYVEMELGRALVLKATKALDAGDVGAPLLISAAKAKMGDVAQLATREAIQFHGGVGMTDAFDIGFFLKRVRVADASLGDSNFHAETFARLRGY